MKSILVKISSKSFNIPRAVRNKNSSPSRQNTSQTRHAKSSGKDLLYNVNILKNRLKFSELQHKKKHFGYSQKYTNWFLVKFEASQIFAPEYFLISKVLLLIVAKQYMKQHQIVQQLQHLAINLGVQVQFSQITPGESIYMV